MQKGRRRIDITGMTFAKWEVLRYLPDRKPGSFYDCQCLCGAVREINGIKLRQGMNPPCECDPSKNLVGNQYGLLTVIAKDERENGQQFWLCRCRCGTETVVSRDNLESGNSQSCNRYKHKKKYAKSA